jgi:hypothetical protein
LNVLWYYIVEKLESILSRHGANYNIARAEPTTRTAEAPIPSNAFPEMTLSAPLLLEDDDEELLALSTIPEGIVPSVKEDPHCC